MAPRKSPDRRRAPAPPPARSRPDDDRGPIRASTSRRLLQELHVMNADGSISADMRRKFHQVNRLVELFAPALLEIADRRGEVVIVDANCGNAYLGFLLGHYLAEQGRRFRLHGIDRSAERVAACRRRAEALGMSAAFFAEGEVRTAELPERADLLVSLHGCDTATDEAILRAVEARIPHVHVVPCCQKELRPLLRPAGTWEAFLRDGIAAAEFSALATDVLRSLWLRTRGYRAELVEFVPLEHSAKNRLLRAKFTRRRDEDAAAQLESFLQRLERKPWLVREGAACPPWIEVDEEERSATPPSTPPA